MIEFEWSKLVNGFPIFVGCKDAKKYDMKILNKLGLLLSVAMAFYLSSCKDEAKDPLDDGKPVAVKLFRFEESLFASKNADDLNKLRNQDSFFFDVYCDHLIGDISGGNSESTESKFQNILNYIAHPDMQDLYQECRKVYPNFEKYKQELDDAFTRYHALFPNKVVPSVYTFVSPFRAAHPCLENTLGIGLDMYLGAEFEPYLSPGLDFPVYQIAKMRPDFLVPNAMKAWIMSELPEPDSDAKMLDWMVAQGKILYLMDRIFPEMPDSLKIGYRSGQIEFCIDQESQIWDNLVSNKLLYNTNRLEFRGYLGDGPFSTGPGVPRESPPGIGDWAGWQIVRNYMKEQPKTGIEQLLKLSSDEILKGAGYKP